ncbi:MAG: DUF72 domain-containing protein, partial [Abditibacteriales bacterium]|nr:DUF72 domain-containing protein [Abditibacteriales bacterium]MDW8367757.1 DUF72 domain-containing protein [Abditibacteriales bacterium]
DWRGFFYPEHLDKKEMLPFYAGHFDTVEVDATYYRLPPASVLERMAQKTPPGFEFTVKANREMTHTAEENAAVFEAFKHAVAPLWEANKLGCVLAQFPWAFRWNRQNQARLRRVRERLHPLPVVVEFRHASWANDEVLDFLRSEGLGFCCVDEPRLAGLMPPLCAATSGIGYVRFHGRNKAKWWKHEHARERYDYLYALAELREWLPKVQRLAAQTEKTYVFFNNHFAAKAVTNAQQFRAMLGIAPPSPQARMNGQDAHPTLFSS